MPFSPPEARSGHACDLCGPGKRGELWGGGLRSLPLYTLLPVASVGSPRDVRTPGCAEARGVRTGAGVRSGAGVLTGACRGPNGNV